MKKSLAIDDTVNKTALFITVFRIQNPIIACHDAAQAKEPEKFIDGGKTGKSITLDCFHFIKDAIIKVFTPQNFVLVVEPPFY